MDSPAATGEPVPRGPGKRRIQLCFIVILLAGLFALIVSLTEYSGAKSAVMVDVVLTAEELQDPDRVRQAQNMLDRIGHTGAPWLFVGLVNVAASLFGLALMDRFSKSP